MNLININTKILLIGCGNMGQAILNGLLQANIENIAVFVPREKDFLVELHDLKKIILNPQNYNADIIIYAIKPHILLKAFQQTQHFITQNTILISVAAGITTTTISKNIQTQKIIRVMPNTPSAVGQGMSVCYSAECNQNEKEIVTSIFNSIGQTLWIENENDMHICTALSGSGPAYFFHMVEAMCDAAKKLGLSNEKAYMLAKQTFIGAAELLKQSEDNATKLRQKVTSPNGTTQAGLTRLMTTNDNQQSLTDIMTETLHQAKQRSIEMSQS